MGKYVISVPYGRIEAKSFRSLIARCREERDHWVAFDFVQPIDFSREAGTQTFAGAQANFCKRMSCVWENVFENLNQYDAQSFAQISGEIISEIEATPELPPYSQSHLGRTIKSWFDGENKEGAMALLYAFATKRSNNANFASVGHRNHEFYNAFSLSLFHSIIAQGDVLVVPTEAALRDEKIAEEVSEELGVLSDKVKYEISKRERETAAFEKKVAAKVKQLHSKYLQDCKRAKDLERSAFNAREKKEEEALESRKESFENLRQLYEAQLRLKHPATMWEERRREHQGNSANAWKLFIGGALTFFALCVLFVYYAGDWVAASFVRSGCNLGSEAVCSGISAKGPLVIAVVLTVLTLALWFLRLQMKLFLSERHLALDARERSAFAETYLSLVQQEAISGEREVVVLQSLFRPTQDGIIQDDNGPDFAVAGILAKALERGK
ncbi:DUF6161 domain-containing protein [Leisingera sp. ANG-M6]|uniref:DUF6161 domain-containing protein n=1 Tax=Leisingera sp. ANG-M6 TaxID=1577900 RepID=UPI000A583489|nr:DUF6161 domain-containing protein [Leisingera sp. ANG-M6]